MDGWWECKALDQLVDRLIRARYDVKIRLSKYLAWNAIKARIINQQRRSKAYVIGERHYDIGNDLYKNMLDKRLNYSCGYWKNAKTLDKAQEAKLDLICFTEGSIPFGNIYLSIQGSRHVTDLFPPIVCNKNRPLSFKQCSITLINFR
ncbi:unnamed protein product [marine sediment metagenome]|uniref:Uncharacterized protein n=1 Tax=marine sediment metagenome TaxID=412755 RepID=X1G1J2_9ZZZZ